MKRTFIAILLTLTFRVGVAQSNEGKEGIQFETSAWADILAKAKKENKYVFLDAFAVWCGPCKWMDKNVFPQAEVGAFFNKNFVNAKIDMEKGEGLELAKLYNVKAYPTYLFVDGNGELVHRIVGSNEAPAFLKASSDALDPEKQYVTQLKKFDNGERNPEFVYKLAHMARDAYDLTKAQELAAEYLKSQSNLLEEKNVKFMYDFTSSASGSSFEFMRKNSSVFEAAIGKEKYQSKMHDIVYQAALKQAGIKSDATKEQALQYIESADGYFKNTLPEQAPKLSHEFAMRVYKTTKDWDNYAKRAINYFEANASSDSNELNSVAWTFFENVDNVAYLQKALDWSLASVKLKEGYGNMDTVANLYYKLGDKVKTKEYASKAIALGKASGDDTSSTEKLLQDIL